MMKFTPSRIRLSVMRLKCSLPVRWIHLIFWRLFGFYLFFKTYWIIIYGNTLITTMCVPVTLKRFLALRLQRTDVSSPTSGYFDLPQLQFACSEMAIATLIMDKGGHNLYVITSDSFHICSLKDAYNTAFRDGHCNTPPTCNTSVLSSSYFRGVCKRQSVEEPRSSGALLSVSHLPSKVGFILYYHWD